MSINIWQAPNTWIEQGGGGIALTATEVLNSFLDGSNVTIAKELLINVTEVFASFNDNSVIRFPINWVDKPIVTTTYTNKQPVSTFWIDKG